MNTKKSRFILFKVVIVSIKASRPTEYLASPTIRSSFIVIMQEKQKLDLELKYKNESVIII